MTKTHRSPAWTVVSPIPAESALWDRWDELNRSRAGHPLLSSTFARLAIRHFKLDCALARLEDSEGTAALVLLEPGSRLRWSLLQPSQSPLPMLVSRAGVALSAASMRALLGEISPVASALDVAADDPWTGILTVADDPAHGVHATVFGTTISVSEPAGFEAYWQSRSRSLRQNVARYFRRIEAETGGWLLDVVSEPERMTDAVRDYALLESAGWKGARGSALHPENAQGQFYSELLTEYAAHGLATVYALRAGGRLIASRLTLHDNHMTVMLKTTFDESMRKYAVGRLLTYLALEHIMRRDPGSRIEFYTRANADALEWATHRRELISATVYRNAMIARMAAALRRARDSIKRAERANPPERNEE